MKDIILILGILIGIISMFALIIAFVHWWYDIASKEKHIKHIELG